MRGDTHLTLVEKDLKKGSQERNRDSMKPMFLRLQRNIRGMGLSIEPIRGDSENTILVSKWEAGHTPSFQVLNETI